MRAIEVFVYWLFYGGMTALAGLFIYGGLVLWRAEGRVPVNLRNVECIQPKKQVRKSDNIEQKIMGLICMLIGAMGVVWSCSQLIHTLA
ncbi:MAG: hypothetical protein IT320_06180 [Anaerolineae bacterium]|nr:hypothetical protein [Anaerolineae bacterium]